ncbi:hypothetical protein RLW55_11640 [Hyphomicrobium sp. B1]|uniref:hypothetical protein n=1 Tax=unclassified Hyphomicrobium TaxID=2619925 RepID=UPI0039C059B8
MKRLALAGLLALTVAVPAAEARRAPRCDGNFQYVRGGWVSTPYCRADQIARVARERGIRTTAEALLAHPADAEEICRFVKADYRVHPACEEIYSIFQIDAGTGGLWLHF